jgi:pullulanase
MLSISITVHSQKKMEAHFPVYDGLDLGLTYRPTASSFRIWAPTATAVKLKIYSTPLEGIPLQVINMKPAQQGTWTAVVKKNLTGNYYAFSIKYQNKWLTEVPDPYAKATGTNGQRAMVLDLKDTHPPGWEKDTSPALPHPTSAIIYELHVRDASIAVNAGIKNKGKFLGLTETGTTNKEGLSTGLDHLTELGITHVHLLPCADFNSVNELRPNLQYNWGYDPQNYNVPEGSYATEAGDGRIRIKEFKQLVQTFHQKGLGVIMDVVYNHTALTAGSNFNLLVPGYYYRHTPNGEFSNATACGNETASEKAMMRRFMIASVLYWVKEYHVDGFRFDLMGVHDIETMNAIADTLRSIKPSLLLYGEGWTAGASPMAENLRAIKKNVASLHHIAVFSDDMRDGIKGSVFEPDHKGFVSSGIGAEESIKFGIVAACPHPQIKYEKVNYSKAAYATAPDQVITYTECHDNHVLQDKLAIAAKEATTAQRKEMHKLALTIVLTSQGISFLHAGTEFLRTKQGVENSFQSGDSINAIDWSLKTKNQDVFAYVKRLIQLRKNHPAFRMETAAQIKENIQFIDSLPAGIVAYHLNGKAVQDSFSKIQVWLNGSNKEQFFNLPNYQQFTTIVHNNSFSSNPCPATLVLKPYSCTVLALDTCNQGGSSSK